MQYTSPLVFFTSLLVSWFAVPGVILVAKRKSLFDKPSETRKIHTKSIPNLGGVAIFLGFYFSILLYQVFCDSVELSSLCASSVLLFFVALKDDFVGTTPRTRLLYQTLIALIVITIGQIYFIHIPFFESFGTFQKTINILASLIFIMGMINAVNFIDGIDGLAATLSLFVFLVFAYVFYLYKETSYSLTALALSGSTLGFLLYNTHPAKIFMGDSGSTFLGLFWAILAIKLNNMSPLQYGTIPVSNPPALAFALMIVPIMDMISVILIRLWLKMFPFQGRQQAHSSPLAIPWTQPESRHCRSTCLQPIYDRFFLSYLFIQYILQRPDPFCVGRDL